MNECKALQILNCRGNQLTAETLNKVFESLPTNDKVITHASLLDHVDGFDYDFDGNIYNGNIDIRYNPGSSTCNRSIATNKGWKFVESY